MLYLFQCEYGRSSESIQMYLWKRFSVAPLSLLAPWSCQNPVKKKKKRKQRNNKAVKSRHALNLSIECVMAYYSIIFYNITAMLLPVLCDWILLFCLFYKKK